MPTAKAPAHGSLSRMRERAGVRAARELRHHCTDAEAKLWYRLRARQLDDLKFRRRRPVAGYVLDFVCLEAGLVIEIDGGQHAEPEHQRHDAQRTRILESQGLRVLRFCNHDVLTHIDGVLQTISDAAKTLTPALSRKRERE